MREAPPLPTYSHLAGSDRVPSEYEIVSSRLLYYVERGFEVNVKVAGWYERYQRKSGLQSSSWEHFADPRATTYTSYTRTAAEHESHLDAVARSIAATGHDRRLLPEWQAVYARLLAPLRFPLHGLEMLAAYVGQMAPAGRITLCAMFQAGDQMRRVHRIAHRMGQLREVDPGFGDDARTLWQTDPHWQPLRRVVERALCAFDWGESFTVLCLVLAPHLDGLCLHEYARVARGKGDFFLGEILDSFAIDAGWHRAWAAALVRHLTGADEPRAGDNRAALAGWLARWQPGAREAIHALAPLLALPPGGAARVEAEVDEWLGGLGLR